jgi:hypothetical protein
MRLVELPRAKPTVRVPEPSRDSEDGQLADFPTDIPVNPPVKRPPIAATDDPEFPRVTWNREAAGDPDPTGDADPPAGSADPTD